MKKVIIAIVIVLCSASSFAQDSEQEKWQENRDQFSIWGGGGLSSLHYSPAVGDYTPGLGFIAGLGYDRFLNYNWSVGLGAEFSLLQSKSKIPIFSERYQVVDLAGYLFDVSVDGKDYAQKQSAYYINIPVQVKFQWDVWKHHKAYIGIGPKIGFPVKSTFSADASLTTKGKLLYADGNPMPGDLFENMPNHGFSTYRIDESGDLPLRLNVAASIEGGMKWDIRLFKQKFGLYTGLFLDYGLNDIRKDFDCKELVEKTPNIYAYTPGAPPAYTANSLLYSKTTDNGAERLYAKRVNTLAFGVKITLSFGIHPFDKKQKATATPQDPPVIDPWSRPLTGNQMKQLLDENTGELIGVQKEEFEKLKAFLTPKDTPELLIPVTGFDVDKSDILPMMHTDLNRKVEILKNNPDIQVILVGHTDNTGNDSHNYPLALSRAESVKTYLIVHGIQSSRLSVESKSASAPIVPNTTEMNKRYNRRVEIVVK
jgi:outer membrane protein OmpA-like peptidoglycan-associated protein